jgi:hypothetical protein
MQGKHFLIKTLLPRLIFVCGAFDAHAAILLQPKTLLSKLRSFRAIVYLLKMRLLKGVSVIAIKDGNVVLSDVCKVFASEFSISPPLLVMILYCFGSTKYTSSDHIPGATHVTNHISKTTHPVYGRSSRRYIHCIDSIHDLETANTQINSVSRTNMCEYSLG